MQQLCGLIRCVAVRVGEQSKGMLFTRLAQCPFSSTFWQI
jgi:hypothetical protein